MTSLTNSLPKDIRVVYHPDGTVKTIKTYVNGQQHGISISSYPFQYDHSQWIIEVSNWSKGALQGLHIRWINGVLSTVRVWNDDEMVTKTLYRESQLHSPYHYLNKQA